MDSLIKQMGVRFSDVGQVNPEEPSRRIPLQKTQSFKGEKKRTQNWLRRQFSRQMSGEFDPNTQTERATAVAAAAYAINKSLEESRILDQGKTSGVPPQSFLSRVKSKKEDMSISNMSEQKKTSDGPEPSMSRQKGKTEDTPIPITEPGRESIRFSGENATTSSVSPDRELPVTAAKGEKVPEKAIDPPPIKMTPTFYDERPIAYIHPPRRIRPYIGPPTRPGRTNPDIPPPIKPASPPTETKRQSSTIPGEINIISQRRIRPDIGPPTRLGRTKPDIPPPIKPASPPTETKRQSSTRPGTTETQADAWERTEMAKIKERYEKLNETILSWEKRKKKKAKRKFDNADSEVEKKRAKALQKFRSDMETIDQIAGGARAQAQEKRRNEEFKVKEKANIIRTTGKVPATTCFCF